MRLSIVLLLAAAVGGAAASRGLVEVSVLPAVAGGNRVVTSGQTARLPIHGCHACACLAELHCRLRCQGHEVGGRAELL